jgi:prephenate dehydrogenase
MKKKYLKNILIYGVGLIGGSIGLRIKNKKLKYFVSGITRSKESTLIAKKLKVVDDMLNNLKELKGKLNFVIICVPPMKVIQALKEILPYLNSNALITDVSSVKGDVYKSISAIISNYNKKYKKNIVYVGSHPMAGTEKRSVKYSDHSIFDNSKTFITPFKGTKKQFVDELEKFWKSLGCETLIISPEEHDKFVSCTSHIPHILSAALVNFVNDEYKKNKKLTFGIASSFKGMTRISQSDEHLWSEIFILNKNNLSRHIDNLIDNLKKIKRILNNQNKISSFLKNTKKYREGLVNE